MINKCLLFIAVGLLAACKEIKTGAELHQQETAYIRQLGLLDEQEQIIKFYSNYKFRNAGNFFTEKRIAQYWIDEKDSSKTKIEFAYYEDIHSIDTPASKPSTYCPYILVKRKNGSSFKVFVNGKKQEVISFFEEATKVKDEMVKSQTPRKGV